MIAFKVSLNGRPVAVAGTPDLGVLTIFVTASGRLGPAAQPTYAHQNGYEIRFNVGGLTSRGSNYREEFLDWTGSNLKPGDVVSIEIVEAQTADRPARRKPQIERRREFTKMPRKGKPRRFAPYLRKRRHGIRSIHD